MKIPQVKIVFDRKGSASNTVAGLVQIEVYYDAKRKLFSTGVKVTKNQWSEAKHVVKHPDSVALNKRIDDLYSRVNDSVFAQVREGYFSFEEVESAVKIRQSDELLPHLLDYRASKVRWSDNSFRNFDAFIWTLEQFGRIKTTGDVTLGMIEEFDKFLAVSKKTSTCEQKHNIFKSALASLEKKGIIRMNPYKDFAIKKACYDDVKYITDDELERVRAYVPYTKAKAAARALFLFQSMTGMAYSDVILIGKDIVIETRDGKHVIVDKRTKTKMRYAVRLLPEALELFNEFGECWRSYSKWHITHLLHEIGKATIGKELTSHMGRHTFATWALRRGISIQYVSKILGHSNITTTQRYAKVLAEDVLEQFDKLE